MNKKRKRIVRENEVETQINKKPILPKAQMFKPIRLVPQPEPPKPVKPVDECLNCKFYFPSKNDSIYGICRRSNVDQQKNDHLWCGEHKRK